MSHATNRLTPKLVREISKAGMHHDRRGLHPRGADRGEELGIPVSLPRPGPHAMGLLTRAGVQPHRSSGARAASTATPRRRDRSARRPALRAAAAPTRQTTFEEVAESSWWTRTGSRQRMPVSRPQRMAAYVYPKIGRLPVALEVGTEVLITMLRPIWQTKHQTANRVRSKVEAVLDYATVRACARAITRRRRSSSEKVCRTSSCPLHHEALPYREVPDFLAKTTPTPRTDTTIPTHGPGGRMDDHDSRTVWRDDGADRGRNRL